MQGRVNDTVYDRSVSKVLNKKPSVNGHIVAAGQEENVSPVLRHVAAGRDAGCAAGDGLELVTASASGSLMIPEMGGAVAAMAINRLMAAGSRPVSASVNVVLPEDAQEQILRKLLKSVDATFSEAGICACQRDVISAEGLCHPVLTVTVTGRAKALFTPQKAQADQDIIMTGYAGYSGSVHLAYQYKEELTEHFNVIFLENMKEQTFLAQDAVRESVEAGVSAMYAAGEGGVFAALWEMAKNADLGVRVNLGEIPLRQETVEICDYLGRTPYSLSAEGSLLLAVTHGQKVLGKLAAAGIPAFIIGHFTDDNDRVVINEDETRYLEPFRGDSINQPSK